MSTTTRPNFYILLELPIDPPETDPVKIDEAIKAKIKAWNRVVNHPKKGPDAMANRKYEKEMRRVLIENPDERDLEAEQAGKMMRQVAKENQQEKQNKIKEAVEMLVNLNNIDDAMIHRAAKQVGVSYEEVKQQLPSSLVIVEQQEIDAFNKIQATEDTLFNKMEEFMTRIQLKPRIGKVTTLYDFLEMPQETTSEVMVNLSDDAAKELAMKPNSAENDARRELCSYVKSIFSSSENRQKYDNKLQLVRFERTKNALDLVGAKGIDGVNYNRLVGFATEDGLKGEDAKHLIEIYCRLKIYPLAAYDQIAPVGEENNFQKCGNCTTYNEADAHYCINCAKPLEYSCVKCQRVSPSSANSCTGCGMVFREMDQYVVLVKDAERDLKNGKLDDALSRVKKATYIIETEESKQLLHKIESAISNVRQQFSIMQSAVQEKKYYAAREQLNQVALTDENKANYFALKQEIEDKIQEVEIAQQHLNQLSPSEKQAFVNEVLTECADTQWALKIKETFPPVAATAFQWQIKNGLIQLNWTPGEQDEQIHYVIYRKANGRPLKMFDGDIVVETKETKFVDLHTEQNKIYFYSIFTYKNNLRAPRPSIVGPIMCYEEVSNFKLVYENNFAQMNWDLPSSENVAIVRKMGMPAKSVTDGDLVYEGASTAYTEEITTKGRTYYYTIFTVVEINGKKIYSEGISCHFVATDLTPVSEVEYWPKGMTFGFKLVPPTDGTLRLFKFNERVAIPENTLLPLDHFNSLMTGKELEVSVNSDNKVNLTGEYIDGYYLFAVSNAEQVLTDRLIYVEKMAPVSNVHMQLVDNKISVTFDWPADARFVQYEYGHSHIEDWELCSQLKFVTKDEYEELGHLLLDIDPIAPVRIEFIAMGKKENQDQCSKLQRFTFDSGNNKPKLELTYELNVKRRLLRSNIFELIVSWPRNTHYLPSLWVVKKVGSQPLDQRDGELILVTGASEIKHFNTKDLLDMEISSTKLTIDIGPVVESGAFFGVFIAEDTVIEPTIITKKWSTEVK